MAENQENMAKVRALMGQAEQVRLGGALQFGVDIDYVSEYGTHFEGTVVFKRPNMKDYLRMGALKSEYLRKQGVVNLDLVDNIVKYMAHVMSVLSTVVVKSPEWLINVEAVEEADILYHVYERFEEWEKSFRKPIPSKSEGNSEPSEGAADMETSEVLRKPSSDRP